ncbi:MAG: citrate synthase [Firmicutes bacterium]|nr:citrate synthase [Bacillota bacterium]
MKAEEVKVGLAGVTVASSKISDVRGEEGKLIYRGYSIEDLAENSNFEETAYLLLYWRLPSEKELKEFKKKLVSFRRLSPNVIKGMKLFCKGTTPMEALRTTVSSISCGIPDARKLSKEETLNLGISLIAKFPVIIANYYRLKHGKSLVKPNPALGYAENFLWMLWGKKPTAIQTKSMDMDFVLHGDHSFNASTFAARIAASTMSDIFSALLAGICTLRGPLHGGAAQEVFEMLKKIKKPEAAEKYVLERLAKHEKVMGFGHRVYKTYDPRARVLKKMAEKLCTDEKDKKFFRIALKVEEIMIREKNLYPNVDFYSAVVYHSLKMPLEIDTPIFAIGRCPGYIAHIIEQYDDNKLIRPLAEYTGEVDLKYVPVHLR